MAAWQPLTRELAFEESRLIAVTTCYQRGCNKPAIASCCYVDGEGQCCATPWCADHASRVLGRFCCRRHVDTVLALDAGSLTRGLPRVQDRAPSLVAWMFRDLDAGVRQILLSHLHRSNAALTADAGVARRGEGGESTWYRGWRLVEDGKNVLAVTVAVRADTSHEIAVELDGAVVVRATPPWIISRDVGETERTAFREALLQKLERQVRLNLAPLAVAVS